ncbi:MAG: four helix bundle protein [Lewinellaceae bacterium]|nr:four helix bundle protein [Lewinellaceae bacterium]
MNAFELESRLINFASRVMDMAEQLPKTYAGQYLASQIIRSATSPALNYGEAQAAESKDDFIHKMKICQKELRETYVCLKLIETRNWFVSGKLSPLIQESNELISIFVASNKTIVNNRSIPNRKSNR